MPPDEPPPPGKSLLTPECCLKEGTACGISALMCAILAVLSRHDQNPFFSLAMGLGAVGLLGAGAKYIRQYRAIKRGAEIYVMDATTDVPASTLVSKVIAVPVLVVLTLAVAAATFAVVMICFAGGRGFAWWWLPVWAVPAALWLFTIRCWQHAFEKPQPSSVIVDLDPHSTEGVWPPPPTRNKEEKTPR